MASLDWHKTDVKLHADSPWLTVPPTEQALRDYRPGALFRPSPVRDATAFADEVKTRTFFGHPKGIEPRKPNFDDYIYSPDELSTAPPPEYTTLVPPPLSPDDPPPPPNFLYPKAGVFTLRKTPAYQRGYVYTTPYNRNTTLEKDHYRMMRVVPPPQLSPRVTAGPTGQRYIHDRVPECVQMVPGVPFAFEIDGDPNELHTIGAVHTFESLRFEPDFWEIYEDTLLVVQGLRGCRRAGNVDEVFPISDWPLKTNDRSPANVPNGSKAGSFNLASTLLKGYGTGVVLPAAQVDTPEFRAQRSTILQGLSRIRQRLLRKTVTKYEYEMIEFNGADMNVIGFGGLQPTNATSVQLNLSPLWQLLCAALGIQGSPHTDEHDEETRKTHFMLSLTLPPDSDAGAFLLARGGLYMRETNTWVIHLFFDGTDVHTGIGATTTLTPSEFQKWVETDLETAWQQSDLGRIGVVSYAMRAAHNRDTSMSMTPSVPFGNFTPDPAAPLRDFATHGEDILGGQEAWANRMGREIVFNFWNQLQHCNLDLDTDIGELMRSISFKNEQGQAVYLQDLPFHPKRDADKIKRLRGEFEYLRQRCSSMRIYIEKHKFLDFREQLRRQDYDPALDPKALCVRWETRRTMLAKLSQDLPSQTPTSISGRVIKILEAVVIGGELSYKVQTDDPEPAFHFLRKSDPRLPVYLVNQFVAAELQKVHPAPILDVPENVVAASEPPSNAEAGVTVTAPAGGDSNDGSILPVDGEVFEVEEIYDVRDTKAGKLYLVKFATYEDAEWVEEANLNCDELLKQFYESHVNISSDSEDSEHPPKRKKRKTTGGSTKKTSKTTGTSKKKISPVLLGKTGDLETLLDPARLASEVREIKEARPTRGSASRLFFQATGSQMLVRDMVDACYIQSRAWNAFDLVIDGHQNTPLEVAGAQFVKLAKTAAAMPQIAAFARAAGIVNRALRWTNAKAHIIIFRWCAKTGPETIKTLFELHRETGYSGFGANPSIGRLVDHIVQFACDATKKACRTSIEPSHGCFGPIPSDLTRIPGNLYGLLPDEKRESILLSNSGAPMASIYIASQRCLLDVFQRIFIAPALRQCHDFFDSNNPRTQKVDENSIYNRALCRGAVLDCVLEACNDDGVLASSALDAVLCNPWVYFQLERADRVGPALLNKMNITLAPLQEWLQVYLQNNTAALESLKGLGDETYCALQEMAAGHAHPDTVSSIAATAAQVPVKPSKPHAQKRPRVAPTYRCPQLIEILPGGTLPRLGLAGLIIREALNWRRGHPHSDSRLRRLLEGQSAAQSAAIVNRNPDHLNPCREFNRYTVLFKEHCPPSKLTGPQGLANTLAWFGTGQGAGTEQFLGSLRPNGGFFKDDASAMIQQFANAKSQNAMNANTMQYDNSRAWGSTPNNHLLAQPIKGQAPSVKAERKIEGRKGKGKGKGKRKELDRPEAPKERYTLQEKFGPLFSDTVATRWTKHLGSAANRDPKNCLPGDLPGWYATVDFIVALEIPAFKKAKLTVMQLVNTLALSGVVQMPSVQEMARWISNNAGLGAVAGLKLLGFKCDTKDEIQASFICLHNYWADRITPEDQAVLGFHPPFTEHVLCKTPRWNRYLTTDKCPSLVEMAEQLGDVAWTRGGNLQDPSAMPFPLTATWRDLEHALATVTEDKDSTSMDVDEPESEDETLVLRKRKRVEEEEEEPEFVQGSSTMSRVIVEEDNVMDSELSSG